MVKYFFYKFYTNANIKFNEVYMPVSPVTTVSPAFCANKTKNKKLKVKTALKTAGVLAAVGVAAAYGAGKGKGGFVDAVIAELQPVTYKMGVKLAERGLCYALFCPLPRTRLPRPQSVQNSPLTVYLYRLSVPADGLKLFSKECFYEKGRRHYGLRQRLARGQGVLRTAG